MKLVLKEFTCVKQTDDPAGDSPYFVVLVGHPADVPMGQVDCKKLDTHVAVLWRKSWDDVIVDGSRRKPDMVVTGHDGKALEIGQATGILIALVEQATTSTSTSTTRAAPRSARACAARGSSRCRWRPRAA